MNKEQAWIFFVKKRKIHAYCLMLEVKTSREIAV
jgi:hypothetical protein